MNQLECLRVGHKYLSIFDAGGLVVEQFADFESVPAAAMETGRDYQLPVFSISRADHTEGSAFWMFLKRGDQRIAGAAAILQDLGTESFESFQRRTARHHYPRNGADVMEWVSPVVSEKMRGRLAYIGELMVREKDRGSRKNLAAFMRLVQLVAYEKWHPDWTYAFIPDRHANVRLYDQYGFLQRIPNAQRWHEPVPEKRASTEWWVGTPRCELEWFFQSEISDLNDIL